MTKYGAPPPGLSREEAQAAAGSVALLLITAAWWALALWPVEAAPAAESAPPAAFDPAAAEREIAELRLKMERMGNVNLEALDQLGEVETSTGDLRTQEQDLTKAREELIEAIQILNKQSRERFTEADVQLGRGHLDDAFQARRRGHDDTTATRPPVSATSSAKAKALSGVSSLDLMTMVLPATSAGASLRPMR